MLIEKLVESVRSYLEQKMNLFYIERCPICGRVPEVRWHNNYRVCDISCRSSLSDSPHFYLYGFSGDPKSETIRRWNTKVRDYQSEHDTNELEMLIRRFI